MTEVPEAFGKPAPAPKPPRGNADDRSGVQRDHKDRYVMPGENGEAPPTFKNGNPIGITRASTIKNVATDKTNINIWRGELTLRGLAKDPGLNAEMMKAVAADDKAWIRKVADKAFIAGGGKVAADRGTEFHEVTENIKKGVQVDRSQIGDQLVARDVTAYLQLLDEAMIRPVQGMQEKTVLMMLAGEKVAGTFDDMFEWWNPDTEAWELVLGDTKTGKDILTWGALEIIVQMAQYVRARKILRLPKDGGATPWGDYVEMPPVSQHHVIIMHAPQNGTAKAYLVDIAGAQEVLDAVMILRRWGSDAKHRFREIGSVDLREAAYMAPPGAVRLSNPVVGPDPQLVDVAPTGGLPQRTPGAALAADEWGGPTPTAPTPDAAEQERKRLDRMAVLDKVATGLGRNDDPDDVGPRIVGEHGPELVISDGAGGILLDGEGNPLAPLAEKGKRGCSVCGRVGHTSKSKNKICLGDKDPAKQALPPVPESAYGPDAVPLPGAPALGTEGIQPAEIKDYPTREDIAQLDQSAPEPFTHPTAKHDEMSPDWMPTPAEIESISAPAYCPGTHNAGWTTRPDMPGLSVCATCGLPTKLHVEGMTKRRDERDRTLGMLAACKSAADVTALVQTLQAKGLWNPEIDQAARELWSAVQFAGWPNHA